MSQTTRKKLVQILGVLALPRGHYAVVGPASLVLDSSLDRAGVDADTEPDTHRLDILVDTALWFELYESTTSGIIWTLCLPDPQNPARMQEPPHLMYELMDITICAGFILPAQYTPDPGPFERAEIHEGFPVYTEDYRGPQWTTST